jgi:transposase
MPWNEADRAKYDVIRERYSTDMSTAELALIAPLLPAPKRRGHKPTDAVAILNALFFMIRCACPWRLLPKDFPPFTTVQNRVYAWRDSGLGSIPRLVSRIATCESAPRVDPSRVNHFNRVSRRSAFGRLAVSHAGSAQRFLSTHAAVFNAFYIQRHLTSARTHRTLRAAAMNTWCQAAAAG